MSAYRSAEIDAAIAALSQARDRIDATIASLEAGRVEVEQAWDRLSATSAAVFDEPPVNLVGRAEKWKWLTDNNGRVWRESADGLFRNNTNQLGLTEAQVETEHGPLLEVGYAMNSGAAVATVVDDDELRDCKPVVQLKPGDVEGWPIAGRTRKPVISDERVEEIRQEANSRYWGDTPNQDGAYIRTLPELDPTSITSQDNGFTYFRLVDGTEFSWYRPLLEWEVTR